MLKEYIYEGNKYYFTGKKWIDSNRIEVPLVVVSQLNRLLLSEMDITSMSKGHLLKLAIDLKDGENIQLAVKVMELLLTKNDERIIKNILPRLVSCYRKVGKSEEAIKKAESYNSMYKGRLTSKVLLTTLAAAYCDIENYEEARKYANRAKAMEGEDSSQELINVYSRIKRYDGGAVKRDTYEDVPDYDCKQLDEEITSVNEEQIDYIETRVSFESRIPAPKEIEFGDSIEREAMNQIWKAIPIELRTEHYDDFKLVCTSLKNHKLTPANSSSYQIHDRMQNEICMEQYGYISYLPQNVQSFFYKVLKENNINLYHSVMAVIGNKRNYTEEDIVKLYFDKYKLSRPYIIVNKSEILDLIHFCYRKLHDS